MNRFGAASTALVLLGAAACAADKPASEDPFVMISGPRAFLSIEVRDASEAVLWRLVADAPTPLPELVWGEVPAGFRQQVPAPGEAPRPLVAGEPLALESITPQRIFHHRGHVARGSRLTIEGWAMELRAAGAGTALDGTGNGS